MRLGLSRTHDSWLSKALSLGFNVPVDSVAEALVRIFPGASMKVGLLRGVLFGGILPGVGIYSPGAGDEVRCFQFIIREGFDAVPFLRFKPGGGAVKFLFSKDAVSKAFFRFETCCRCTGALQRNSVLGHHPGVSFLVRLLAEAAGEFRFQGIHQLCVRFSESGRCRG